MVNYISMPEEAERVVSTITACGVRAIAHRADVSVEAEVTAMFARMCEEFRTVDILVANAGLQQDAPVAAMTLAHWNRVLSVNLTLCARAAIAEFRRRGVVENVSCAAGKIICMSSVHLEIP